MELTARQKALYETIKSAALAGEVCPTNREIAQRSGLASTSTVADVLGRLHRKGVVAVKRFNRARVVALPDLGIATAEPPARSALGHAPHWRDRPPGVSYRPAPEPSVFPPPMPWRLKWRPQRWQPKACQYIAGPLCGMLLADQGADVIRVDPPGGPVWNTPANATWNRNTFMPQEVEPAQPPINMMQKKTPWANGPQAL